MQQDSIQSTEKQLDRLLNMATNGVINSEEYKSKKSELQDKLNKLKNEQAGTIERTINWYEIVGDTLGKLENANSEFKNGDLAIKRRILLAIGSNPVLTDGKITVEPFKWLLPLKKNKQELTNELDKVRTGSQQIEKDPEGPISQLWGG